MLSGDTGPLRIYAVAVGSVAGATPYGFGFPGLERSIDKPVRGNLRGHKQRKNCGAVSEKPVIHKLCLSVADPSLVEKGQALYRGGNKESGAAACLTCHGPTGRGNPSARYPLLRGQHATYIAATLREYAAETRKSDGATKIMRDIAKRLSEDDIVAVAAYVQGLR